MLVLVVGPSGAGKDTMLGVARTALARDPRIRFVRRVITRPAEAGGEDHESVSEAAFVARSFALQWQAHGLRYGIPADIAEDLLHGQTVVANVSRGVIVDAAERYPTRVIAVTAPPHILARRLTARGRETEDNVAKRLSRTVPIPSHISVETIVNDRTLAEAAGQFVSALIRVAESVPPAQMPHRATPG
jgi:phosphonate metabolism protein PhnN/1,5-bisphosphokinase (PRPP-forming)